MEQLTDEALIVADGFSGGQGKRDAEMRSHGTHGYNINI
jgi:hypothetical protein